jgi:hypothetical protein
MRVICNAQQLHGDYGTVTAEQEFECPDDVAPELIKAGLVRALPKPKVLYETKPILPEYRVIVPEAPEVSARPPFRNVPLSHEESPDVAPESDSVLPGSDVSQQRNDHRGGRRGRARSDTER